MTFRENSNIENGFEDLFTFKNQNDEIEHDASMLMFRFLSEIDKINNNRLSRKSLSKLIGTSASYVTQLFRGDKLINMTTLAKFEKALNIKFEVKACSLSEPQTDYETVLLDMPYVVSGLPAFKISDYESIGNIKQLSAA